MRVSLTLAVDADLHLPVCVRAILLTRCVCVCDVLMCDVRARVIDPRRLHLPILLTRCVCVCVMCACVSSTLAGDAHRHLPICAALETRVSRLRVQRLCFPLSPPADLCRA